MARRPPRISSLLSLVLCWVPAAAAAPDDRAATIDRIRSLARAGRHDEVEVQARALLDTLPPDDRPEAWAIDLSGLSVQDARIGRRHVYVLRTIHPGDAPARRRELAPEVGRALDPRGDYGRLIGVTCVDAEAGRPLWSRRLTHRTRMAVDPRDDALWTWERDQGTPILRIDAATGAETPRGRMPRYTEGADAVRGLRVDGLRLWSAANANTRDPGRDDELDVETGEVRRGTIHPALVSPDGRRALREVVFQSSAEASLAVVLDPAAGDHWDVPWWSFRSGGYSANPPVWFGDDVLILAGKSWTYGAVSRVDGHTERVRWTRALPEPAHSPGYNQLAGNAYPPRGWSAIGEAAAKVIVIGSFGTVFFLDPETGDTVARLGTGMSLLALPRVIAGRLVLIDADGLRAIPMRRILGEGKPNDDWLTLQELWARSSLARGRPADAMAIAEVVARQMKDSPVGWTLLAEAREAMGRGPEAVAARVAAMDAAASPESPVLRDSYGLVCRLPTAPISAAPVVDGPHLLVGCRDGRLLTIDTRSLRVVDVQQAPVDIASLSLDGTRLLRQGDDRRGVPARSLGRPPGDLRPGDPLIPAKEPPGLPPKWYEAMLGDGPSVAVGSRRARGLHGGRVRVFDDATVIERPPLLPGIEWWRIALVSNEPIGYGTGGVYRLDRDLRPASRIIDAGQLRGRSNMAYLLDGDDDYLCVLAGPFDAMRLQLWSRDATKLLREAAVRPGLNPYDEPYRLRRLGDGYLLSAGELVWLPRAAAGRVWRFSVHLDPATGPSLPRFDRKNANFGVARVVGDRLFVAASGGGVYGFEVPSIVGTTGDPARRGSRRTSESGQEALSCVESSR